MKIISTFIRVFKSTYQEQAKKLYPLTIVNFLEKLKLLVPIVYQNPVTKIIIIANMSFSILFPTNQFTAASKSPEEIQILTLPACLSLTDVLTHIANKGLPPQYTYLYKHLSQSHKNVLNFACAKAPTQQSQNQLLIVEAFKTLLLQKWAQLTLSEKQSIFDTCLECLNSHEFCANEQVLQLLQIILKWHNDKNKLIRRLQNLALELGKVNQPSMSKITASRLVTILVGFNGCALKNELFDILKRVLGDTEAEARKIGLSQIFPKLLRNLDLQFIELHFQQKIYEAVWDENQQIGVLALQVILRNASKFSLLQQNSRIVKLFVDSLTSKREKVAIMATSLMGQAYQKLQSVILRNQGHCVRFWKSLVELSQSKNQKILNNMVYNLPGILSLAAPFHRVDPLCDIFVELFYNPKANKLLLTSYFHEMVKLFPAKWNELKDLFYWMLNQLLQEEGVSQQAIKITSKAISKLSTIKDVFLSEVASAQRVQKQEGHFEPMFCNYLIRYMDLLIRKKVSAWLIIFYSELKKIAHCFKSDFVQQILIPRLYSCLKGKVSGVEMIVETIVILLSKQGNPMLTNLYFSKVSAELMKSFRAHERELALRFYLCCSYHFSIQTFNEFKLGEKILCFNSDKNLKIREFFIRNLGRVSYFLQKQQKIEYSIIVNRLRKDSDNQIQQLIASLQFIQQQSLKQQITQKSKLLRESEREKLTSINLRKQQEILARKPGKDLRKDQAVRKRIQSTKVKNKVQAKEAPKRRMTPIMSRASSITNVFRQQP